MKNWKKVLLCIVISVLITTFIGTTLSVIFDRVLVHLLIKEQEKEMDSKENYYAISFMQEYFREEDQEYIDEIDIQNKLENVNIDLSKMEHILIEDKYRNMANIYSVTAGLEIKLFIFSIEIGIITGILIYLIFIKQIKAKKVLLISIIFLAVLFLIFNAGGIIADIIDGMFELSNLANTSMEFNIFMIVYIVIVMILYFVNLIHQKTLAHRLNNELCNKKN